MNRTLLSTVAAIALTVGGVVGVVAQTPGGAQPGQSGQSTQPGQSAQPGQSTQAPRGGAERQGQRDEQPGVRQGQREEKPGVRQGQREEKPGVRQGQREEQPGARQGQREQPPGARQGQRDEKQPATNQQGQREDQRNNRQGQRDDERTNRQGQRDQQPATQQGQQRDQRQPGTRQGQRDDDTPRMNMGDQGDQRPTTRQGQRDQRQPMQQGRTGDDRDVNITGSIRVDQTQATRIHDELTRRGSRRENIDIDVNIGASLPSRVRPRPLPASIVRISPEFRGYSYVLVRDEIVIVEPRTRKIVTVIRQGGDHARAGSSNVSRVSLNASQKRRIRSEIDVSRARSIDWPVREGSAAPSTIEFETWPSEIVTEIPELRAYRYFVDDRKIVVVDPQTRVVVDVIE